MSARRFLSVLTAAFVALPAAAQAGDADETFRWLSETDSILTEGVLWDDTFGDGKDRYKSGGLTQSLVFPERVFSDERWFPGYAAAIEIQGRAFVATPDDTSRIDPADRPYAQYAGVGVHLRLTGSPDRLTDDLTASTEDRIGVEIGWQGDPLPLFDIQEAIHARTGMGPLAQSPANVLGSELLVNAELRRTWRIHGDHDGYDFQYAPYVHASAGMRENAVRLGSDFIIGSSLEARTWNSDLAVGALIPGGSRPRGGFHWLAWIGGDVGVVASDALLDGGFGRNGPSVEREAVTARARAGVMVEYEDLAVSYSLTWLSPEFRGQPSGQVIGAVQIKIDF